MQERPLPDSQTQRLPLARKLAAISFTLAAAALALTTTGCPMAAELDNPEQYPAPAKDMTPMTPTADPCETACVTQLFSTGAACTICHNGGFKSGMLDLTSAGFTSRLRDVAATHAEAKGTCQSGDKLIDTANPANSWLWKKVDRQHGTCGDPMPPGDSKLPATELACVKTYVECVAGGKTIGGGT